MTRWRRALSRALSTPSLRLREWNDPGSVRGAIATIAPADGMYQGDNAHYFRVGHSALRCVRLALAAAGKAGEGVGRILDLPCGHGRVLRMLQAAFPRAELVACDLNRDGVDFCARTFGAIPVFSSAQPAQVRLPGPFDLIWCGSLFTHLERAAWPGFLELFRSVLALGGVAIFTTHGRFVAGRLREGRATYDLDRDRIGPMLADYDASGFGFGRQAAAPSLGTWGISISRPSWVLSLLEGWPDVAIVAASERAWDDHQDVFAFARRAGTAPEDRR